MIRLLTHNGFTEPSSGVGNKGLAIRGSANLKVRAEESQVIEKLYVSLHRTSKDWPNAYIKIQFDDIISYRLHTEDIGQKEISIDLPREIHAGDIEITFSIFPQGIFKFLNSFPFTKWKSLVRDTILLRRLYLDRTKIINCHDSNRFAYRDTSMQKQIQVRILGFFGQTFGLGEAARRTFNCLQKSDISVIATQIPYSGKHHGKDNSVKSEKSIPTKADDIRIFHFNGDHFEKLISDWGESILDCRYKIGFWHWELTEFPDDYLPWFDMVDEVWVPSRFIFDAIAPKSSKPVQIIPLALNEQIIEPSSSARMKFSIPENKVVFLIIFDFYSILERKNPISGIKAFSRLLNENKYKDQVHLVVKISNHHAYPEGYKLLQEALSLIDLKKLTLILNVLPRNDMLQLINSCDALISLHRSEGFGLHLAEAMAMGKAVIGTNWSGNTDFMNSKNSYPVDFELVEIENDYGPYRKGNIWAEASVDNAVEKILTVTENVLNNNSRINIEARRNVLEKLIEQRINKMICGRLEYIKYNIFYSI